MYPLSQKNIRVPMPIKLNEPMARFEQFATIEDLAYIDVKISEHDREIFKMKNRACTF